MDYEPGHGTVMIQVKDPRILAPGTYHIAEHILAGLFAPGT